MKESEIISKILADWEGMGANERDKLGARYVERNYISPRSSSSKSGSKRDEKSTRKLRTPHEERLMKERDSSRGHKKSSPLENVRKSKRSPSSKKESTPKKSPKSK